MISDDFDHPRYTPMAEPDWEDPYVEEQMEEDPEYGCQGDPANKEGPMSTSRWMDTGSLLLGAKMERYDERLKREVAARLGAF